MVQVERLGERQDLPVLTGQPEAVLMPPGMVSNCLLMAAAEVNSGMLRAAIVQAAAVGGLRV